MTDVETIAAISGPRHLIITVFGLYARERGGVLAVSEVIRMLAELGVDSASVRSSISRLKRTGVLESVRASTGAGYRLAPKLEDVFSAGDERILHPHRASAGDPWVLASFSVPERERHLRHRIRSILTRLGFGQVTSGLWIAPASITAELENSIARADLADYVELFRATHLTAEHARETVGRWWDLDALDALYRDFIRKFEPVARRWQTRNTDAPAVSPADDAAASNPVPVEAPNPDDAAAFRDYLTILTAWRRFPYLDPGLPLEYLPNNWSGVAAEQLFNRVHEKLSEPARRFAQLG